ncbi:MAG: response regulator, partial [Bellilinea sp.]|nr:response regulator [Bellilinea sp.]
IEEHYPPRGQRGTVSLSLVFTPIKHRTILVVDDQAAALKMFERYLSRTGIQVVGNNNPEQTLQLAAQLQPDLIILDVMMPRLDGWEVLQSLQSNPATKNIPVLVCSAWDEPDLAYSLGAAAFLKKPLLQRNLLDVLYQLNLLE